MNANDETTKGRGGETLEEIVEELRIYAKAGREVGAEVILDVDDWADRIEAAIAEERRKAKRLRDALETMVKQECWPCEEKEIDRDTLCGRCTASTIMHNTCKHDGSCWVDMVWNVLEETKEGGEEDRTAAPRQNADGRMAE